MAKSKDPDSWSVVPTPTPTPAANAQGGVNTAAAGPGGAVSVFGGAPTTQGGTSITGSTQLTVQLPAYVAKSLENQNIPGLNGRQLTGDIRNLSLLISGQPDLAQYFQDQASAAGTSLYSNTTGKFDTTSLEYILENAKEAGASFDPKQVFKAYASQKAAADKAQAALLTDQNAMVKAADLNLAAANVNATATEKSSAVNSLENFFTQYGIDTTSVPRNLLDGFTKQFTDMVYGQGIAPTSATAKELFQTYDGGKLYDAAFPGLTEYNNSPAGKTAPMSISQFNTYRDQFRNLASTYNLPAGFLNDATLKKMVTNGVSMANLTDRIAKGYAAYEDASPAEKQLLAQQYGITPGQAVAYFLDTSPGKVHSLNSIKEAMTAAPLELKGQQVGLAGFGQQQAEQLGGLVRSGALGQPSAPGTPYDFTQAYNAETAAARDAALQQQRLGNNTPGTQINSDTLLASQVAGYTGNQNVLQGQTQVQAQRAVQTAEQSALAPFEKGGGYEETQKGVIGAGSARQ